DQGRPNRRGIKPVSGFPDATMFGRNVHGVAIDWVRHGIFDSAGSLNLLVDIAGRSYWGPTARAEVLVVRNRAGEREFGSVEGWIGRSCGYPFADRRRTREVDGELRIPQ